MPLWLLIHASPAPRASVEQHTHARRSRGENRRGKSTCPTALVVREKAEEAHCERRLVATTRRAEVCWPHGARGDVTTAVCCLLSSIKTPRAPAPAFWCAPVARIPWGWVGLDLKAISAPAFNPPTAQPNIPSWKEARPLLDPWRWSDGARARLTNATPTPLRNAHAACALSRALAVTDVASTRLAQECLPMRRPKPLQGSAHSSSQTLPSPARSIQHATSPLVRIRALATSLGMLCFARHTYKRRRNFRSSFVASLNA